jgi:uncharacterized protein YodC (DUF2158 family)
MEKKIPSIGATAHLLSGGPLMTVQLFHKEDSTPVVAPDLSPLGTNGLVKCVWFDETGKLHTHSFPLILLKIESDEARTEVAAKPIDEPEKVDEPFIPPAPSPRRPNPALNG